MWTVVVGAVEGQNRIWKGEEEDRGLEQAYTGLWEIIIKILGIFQLLLKV